MATVVGASPKSKRLHLEEDGCDSLFHYPVQTCDHDTFTTQTGCRKHVKNKHGWFYYFDSEPDDCKTTATPENREDSSKKSCCSTKLLPSFDISSAIGKLLESWLTGSGGGCKSSRQAQKVVHRSFQYIRFAVKMKSYSTPQMQVTTFSRHVSFQSCHFVFLASALQVPVLCIVETHKANV